MKRRALRRRYGRALPLVIPVLAAKLKATALLAGAAESLERVAERGWNLVHKGKKRKVRS
jgi:hypothetical protein